MNCCECKKECSEDDLRKVNDRSYCHRCYHIHNYMFHLATERAGYDLDDLIQELEIKRCAHGDWVDEQHKINLSICYAIRNICSRMDEFEL